MTIRHLKIFITVAHTKNMSEAAEKLFISQPTVSQTISELEQHYHTKLFERYPKELFITPAGATLLEYAYHVVKSFDNLDEVMAESNTLSPLRVGGTLTVGSCILCQILDQVRETFPNISLSVQIDNTKTIETKLLQNELDIAIVEGFIHRKEIITQPIIQDCLVLICSREHPFAKRKQVAKEELSQEPFILREKGSGTREMFVNFMQANELPLTIQWECNSSASIKQGVIHNYGLTVLSSRLVQENLKKGELCIVPVKDCSWNRFFHLCYHKDKTVTQQMKQFQKIASEFNT